MELEKIERVIAEQLATTDNPLDGIVIIRKHLSNYMAVQHEVIRRAMTKHKDPKIQSAIERIIGFIFENDNSVTKMEVLLRLHSIRDSCDDVTKVKLITFANELAIQYKPWWRLRAAPLKKEIVNILEGEDV